MTMDERMDRLGDRQLATLIGALLFVVAGWPVLFLRIAPYQDLPDHLATLCVLLDPGRYPEFVSNGWLKSNTLMFGLLLLFSGSTRSCCSAARRRVRRRRERLESQRSRSYFGRATPWSCC